MVSISENVGCLLRPNLGQQSRLKSMSNNEVLEQALRLKAEDRFAVIEGLLKSLDVPDEKIDDIWTEEAEKRLEAYRDGRMEGVPMEEVFRTRLTTWN